MKNIIGTIKAVSLCAAIFVSTQAAQAQDVHGTKMSSVALEQSGGQQESFITGYMAPRVWRNQTRYNLYQSAVGIIAIITEPPQPNQPIYGWRTHQTKYGPGQFGFNATLIGYTDQNGEFTQIYQAPVLESLCGNYKNEAYAVGSPNGLRSAPIDFDIYIYSDTSPQLPSWHVCSL